MNESEIHEKIDIIVRQTNYTFEEAKEKFLQQNMDYTKVIINFMNPKKKIEEKKIKSVNQEIFKNIRNYLDNGVQDKARQRGYYQENVDYKQTLEIEVKDKKEDKKEDNNDNTIINI